MEGSAFGGGGSAARGPHHFDLSDVDFEYVARLTKKDSRKLQGIIAALEADAGFPDLLKACRAKLAEVDEKSAARVAAAAQAGVAPSRAEQADVLADLSAWSAATKEKDAALRASASAGDARTSKRAPLPVRGHTDSAFEDAAPTAAKPAVASSTPGKPALSLGKELDPSTLLPAELAAAALLEKEKGNECFRAKEFDESIAFYTRSLHLKPTDTAVLNNRALAFIRVKNLDAAMNDALLVLKHDPSNWKGLWRRGQVWEGKNFLERALDDFQAAQAAWARSSDSQAQQIPVHPDIRKDQRRVEKALLDQEPNHPYVQHLKPGAGLGAKATEQANKPATTQKQEESKESKEQEAPAKAFKRMAIAEVDDDEDEDEDEADEQKMFEAAAASVAGATQPAAASAAAPMRRMPIAEVESDEEGEEVEIKSTPAAAASSVPTAAPAAAAKPVAAQPAPAAAAAARPTPAAAPRKAEPAFHSKNGGVMIELVDDEEEAREAEAKAKSAASASSSAAGTSAAAPARPAASSSASSAAASSGPFVMPPIPASAAAFQRDWSELRAQARPSDDLFAYLRRIDPPQVGRILGGGGALDSKLFGQIVSLVASHYLVADASRALAFMQALIATPRFALNVGMLEPAVRTQLKQAVETLVAKADGGDSVDGVSVEAIRAVGKKFA